MSSLGERIFAYLLGGAAGTAAGFLLVSFRMPILGEGDVGMISMITAVIGVLISVVIVEARTTAAMRKNNAIRDETVALITHEMRTGLTSSGWAIGLVLDKYASVISDEHKRLLRGVVDSMHTTVMHSVNLLDVSLLDIQKLSISLEWTRLEKVQTMFVEILEKYQLGAKGHGITLTSSVSLSPELLAEVDLLRLRIILENLLENAIQYSTLPEKRITVDVSNTEHDMNISVRDTGIGIPQSEQQRIFSEFYRASNARRTLSTGSGIGLYTCLKYVTAHRGTVRFESKENEGTAFFISIPLKTAADVKQFLSSI